MEGIETHINCRIVLPGPGVTRQFQLDTYPIVEKDHYAELQVLDVKSVGNRVGRFTA